MERPRASRAPAAHAVQVISTTWARDSHDLFDFEAQQLHTQTFTVAKPTVCVRSGTDIQMIGDHALPIPGGDPLLRLAQKDGCFWVDKAPPANNSKKLWQVIRDMPMAGHKLTEGDVIKLGRFKFRVRQLGVSPDVQPELRLDSSDVVAVPDKERGEELAATNCRICLLEGSSEEDPLITPCHCKGSIEHVHLGCLRHWIRGRLDLLDKPGDSYFYRSLTCELCKAAYPTYVEFEAKREPLVEVPQILAPFIVLENMVRDSHQHTTRGLHVVSLAEKVLKLGRGHECEVRIADVSISRTHAMIRYEGGEFVLEDNNSKFGTLVAMKKPRQMAPGTTLSIQMGRTVLSLSVQADVEPVEQGSLLQLPSGGATAQDERALRLSLLTRDASYDARFSGRPDC